MVPYVWLYSYRWGLASSLLIYPFTLSTVLVNSTSVEDYVVIAEEGSG